MSVPDFQTIMRPTLVVLSSADAVSVQNIRTNVASMLGVGAYDLAELLGSGKQTRFANRVGWALTHMGKAGLVERSSRGYYRITSRGEKVLLANSARIDMSTLADFVEYREFRSPKPIAKIDDGEIATRVKVDLFDGETVDTELSPAEALGNIVEVANADLVQELLSLILAQPPIFLERLALRVLSAMGYGGREGLAEHTGKSGDSGLDGLVRQDALGLELIGVQAKRYEKNLSVHRPEIQAFVGALQGAQASRGVFFTTGKFSSGARAFAESVPMRLVLLDGEEMARAMIVYNVGVSVKETFELKQVSENFVEE